MTKKIMVVVVAMKVMISMIGKVLKL